MRTIDTLKDNEAIFVPNKKTAKKLAKAYPELKSKFKSIIGGNSYPACLHKTERSYTYSLGAHLGNFKQLPASDFLPKTNKERIEELEKRIETLETGGGTCTEILRNEPVTYVYNKQPQAEQFEVGEWVIRKAEAKFQQDAVICICEDNKNCYGFNLTGEWTKGFNLSYTLGTDLVTKSTTELVSEKLIAEAKRRGYDANYVYSYDMQSNMLFGCKGQDEGVQTIFDNGKWAEVVEQPKELKELPEKWCVKSSDEVVDWFNVNNQIQLIGEYNHDEKDYFHYPFYLNGQFEHHVEIGKPKEGYTEISLSDFKRLVLDKPKDIDWSKPGQLVQNEKKEIWEILSSEPMSTLFKGICRSYDADEPFIFGSIAIIEKKSFTLCPSDVTITLKNE